MIRINTISKKIHLLKSKREIIILLIVAFFYSRVDIAYSMEHGKQALDVANALAENDILEAERLLQILQNRNLTEQQIRNLNDIINRAVETRVGSAPEYQVQDFELQNAGNTPQESFNYRGFFLTLVILGFSILTIYLIMRYWDEIRDFLFGGLRVIPPQALPAMRAILFHRIHVLRNNPRVLHDIADYIDNLPEE